MPLLLLETSGRAGSVALARDGVIVRHVRLDAGRRNAKDLAPAVAHVLAAESLTARDLRAVVVGRGPGSYTGLRVGVMSAKALAYAVKCRLVAPTTFAVIAAGVPAEVARFDVVADAQKDNIYVQSFANGDALGEIRIVAAEEWLQSLTPDVRVTGPGLAKVGPRLPTSEAMLPEELWHPTPNEMLRLALRTLDSGGGDDVFAVEPLYLRPSSAEEQWDRR